MTKLQVDNAAVTGSSLLSVMDRLALEVFNETGNVSTGNISKYYGSLSQLFMLSHECAVMRSRQNVQSTINTVEPPNNGHIPDPASCPLLRGCPLSEVIFYRVCILEYFWFVLCSEVCPLSECPLSEVSL